MSRVTLAALLTATLGVLLGALPSGGQAPVGQRELTLDEVIDIALARNPSLRAAERDVAAADAGIEIAKGATYGRADFFTGYLYGGFEDFNRRRLVPRTRLLPTVAQDDIFASHTFSGGIGYSIPIYTGGRLTAEIEASRLSARLARERLQQTNDDLILNLSATFYTILRVREDIKATRGSLKALEEARKNIQSLVDVGRLPRVDLFKINTRLAAVRQELIRVENAFGVTHGVLNTLMGLDDVTQRLSLAGQLEYEPIPFDVNADIDEALKNRPEYRAAKLNVGIRDQEVRVARAARLPEVSIGLRQIGAGNDRGSAVPDFSATANFTVPIFTGGVLTSRITQAEARLGRAREDLVRLKLDISQEVQTADLNSRETEERIKVAAAALDEARETLRVEQLKTEVGKGIIEDLLDAQAAELEAEFNHTRALAEYNTALVARKKAIGRVRAR